MRAVLAGCLLAVMMTATLAAQDSTAAAVAAPDSAPVTAPLPRDSTRADSVPVIRPPVSPMGAFWRSLLIPGWGQAKLGRRTAGAFFLAAEGVTLGMTISASSQLRYMQQTGSRDTESKSQQRQDWLVLMGVNHLLAAMEAYVSAHLWDFPGDLSVQATPQGGVAGAVSVPVRLP